MPNFCTQCGTKLTDGIKCPSCGYVSPEAANMTAKPEPVTPQLVPEPAKTVLEPMQSTPAPEPVQSAPEPVQPAPEPVQPTPEPEQPQPETGSASAGATAGQSGSTAEQTNTTAKQADKKPEQDTPNLAEDILDKATKKINELAGGKGSVKLNLKSLFSEVFKKHTNSESEAIFISGTEKTTPAESEISSTWPKPWLFARVFAVFFITYFALYFCWDYFANPNVLPGMIFMGAIAVPFSLIVFFLETNAPRNISFFTTLTIFLVGGAMSLVITLLLFSFVTIDDGYMGAILVGLVEETGKLTIIAYYVKKTKNVNYVLNGLLIGAAVGAGFATFETAGYILNYGLSGGNDIMMEVLIVRALLAPGGHVIWGAILGGALVLAKGRNPFEMSQLSNKKFVAFYIMCIAMHAIWDMPIQIEHYLVQIAMTVCAWIIALVLIDVGLKEISALNDQNEIETVAEKIPQS